MKIPDLCVEAPAPSAHSLTPPQKLRRLRPRSFRPSRKGRVGRLWQRISVSGHAPIGCSQSQAWLATGLRLASEAFLLPVGPAPSATPGQRAWALALSAGLAAGLIAWAGGEATLIPETGAGTRGGNTRSTTVAMKASPTTRSSPISNGCGCALRAKSVAGSRRCHVWPWRLNRGVPSHRRTQRASR